MTRNKRDNSYLSKTEKKLSCETKYFNAKNKRCSYFYRCFSLMNHEK